MFESSGTISFSPWRKEIEGGNKRLMLNTLGSMSSLCPMTGPSPATLLSIRLLSGALVDFDTNPGTEA
jgi:hypothetical protein